MVGCGTVVPKGALPVFSVDTKEEAKRLIASACMLGYHGKYIARELATEQTLDNLFIFADKLARMHDAFVRAGSCACR